jgi:hypothetical protein
MSPRKPLVVPIPDPPEIARQLWEQKKLPVIYRPKEGKLLVKLPYRKDNRDWMRRKKGTHQPEYHEEGQYWITPRSWFDRLLRQSMVRYGGAYTIRPVKDMAICARKCWNAKGPDCDCSCEGRNHGKEVGEQGWHEISETLAIAWGSAKLRCCLVLPTGATPLDDEPPAPAVRPTRVIARYANRHPPARA